MSNDIKNIVKEHYEKMNDNIYFESYNKNNNFNNDLENNNNLKSYFFKFDSKPEYLFNNFYEQIEIFYKNFKIYLFIKSNLLNIYGGFTNFYTKKIDENKNEYFVSKYNNNKTWENPFIILICLIDNMINPDLIPIIIESEENNYIKITFSNNNILYIDKINKKVINEKKINNKKNNNVSLSKSNNKLEEDNKKKLLTEIKKDEIINKNEIKNNYNLNESTYNLENIEKDFFKLLKDKKIQMNDSYNSILEKIKYDPIYKNIQNSDLKKTLFNKYINNLKKISEENKLLIKSKKKNIYNYKLFLKSLLEQGKITNSTTFTDFSDEYEKNEVFQNIDNQERELIFNELKSKLKKIYEDKKSENLFKYNKFIEKNFPINLITNNTTEEEIKKILKKQPEYLMIPSKSERNKIILDYLNKVKNLKQFNNNIINSNLETLENNYNKKNFKKLLESKIKTEITYEEAMNKLNNFEEYKKIIDEKERIEIYKDFLFKLKETHKMEFSNLLEEKIGLNQEINWPEAQHMLQNDIRYRNVQSKDRELLFNKFNENIYNRILSDFENYVEQNPDLFNKDTILEGKEYENLLNKINVEDCVKRINKFPDKRDKIIRNKVKSERHKFYKDKKKNKDDKFLNKKIKRNLYEDWKKGEVI